MKRLEHVHITVNARIAPGVKPLSRSDAQRFVDRLMRTIKMKPLGELNWANAEDLEFPGQSFVQMITTSHCSLHLFNNKDGTNEIYFDLYSCRKFDDKKVIAMLDEEFGLQEWHGILYTRDRSSSPKIRMIGTNSKEIMIAKAKN